MKYLINSMLGIVGIIHLLPLSGVLGSAQLFSLYQVELNDPNLVILMRHRAVLFGILGAFIIYAVYKPTLHIPAIIGGLVSVISFLVLSMSEPEYNASVLKIIYADVVAFGCLLVAMFAKWQIGRSVNKRY